MITIMTGPSEDDDEVVSAWVARLDAAVRTGESLDLAADLSPMSILRNPAHADVWRRRRQLPAAALRAVLIDRDLVVNPHGLRINGARITGPLDLENLQFDHPLHLTACRIDQGIKLSGSTWKEVKLAGTHLMSLDLDGATITGDLVASGGFTAVGEVRGLGANIGGSLNLDGATLTNTNPDGFALLLDGATLSGGLLARGGFTAVGEVRGLGANIGGSLTLDGATLTNPDGIALALDGATITGDLLARGGFTATGTIRAFRADIGGLLELDGATLTNTNPDGFALALDGATITGGLLASGGFTATGTIRALRANIGGSLTLDGATLTNPDGFALLLEGATISGGLFARGGFTAEGEVRAFDADIGGPLELDGATLTNTNPDGIALALDGATITGDLLARAGFTAEGEVRALRASIGALNLSGATLTNPDGIALLLDRATIGTLRLTPTGVDGIVDLTRATITDLNTPENAIPPGQLISTGWQITDMHGLIRSDRGAATRWLNTTPSGHGFTAQPWHALAAVYDRNGQPADARRLRYIAANKVTKQAPRYSKPLRWTYRAVAGHGYYPLLAAVWLVIALILGTVLVAYNRADFVPTDPTAAARTAAAATRAQNYPDTPPPSPITANEPCAQYPDYPCFNRMTYALTNVIPASNGNPKPDWTTKSGASLIVTWGLPILRILSWIFTAILLAGVTGLLRKT